MGRLLLLRCTARTCYSSPVILALGQTMRRREFISMLGGGAAWPIAAGAQQSPRLRRVGVLMETGAEDPLGQARSAAFAQGLQQLGCAVGVNVRIDIRWGAGNTERYGQYAAELLGLA